MCYDLGMYCKIWLHCISKYQKKKFYVPRQNALSKIMRFQELTIFAGKNISMGKYIFCTIYNFTVRQVTSALKKKLWKSQQNFPAYTNILRFSLTTTSTWEPPLYMCVHQLDKLSHTRPFTQTLLPLHACAQTPHSHIKPLARNQSSELCCSPTRTQTCFIPSPALEKHGKQLSLFDLPTQASQIRLISAPDASVSLAGNTLLTNRPSFSLLPT